MRSLPRLVALFSSLVACASTPHTPPRSPVRAIVVRLRPGDDLKRELDALARREHLAAASISTCVGSLERVNIRIADRHEGTTLEGRREIVSLAFYQGVHNFRHDVLGFLGRLLGPVTSKGI